MDKKTVEDVFADLENARDPVWSHFFVVPQEKYEEIKKKYVVE